MIKILLVDDQHLVRSGFRMILDAQTDMTVVGENHDVSKQFADREPAAVRSPSERVDAAPEIELPESMLAAQSHSSDAPIWYSVTRVSKKFFSFARSVRSSSLFIAACFW